MYPSSTHGFVISVKFRLLSVPMSPKPASSSSGKHTWSAKKQAPRTSHRNFNLLVVSALFLAAVYWFWSTLWNSELAPDTYLLHLQIANRDSSDVHPIVLVSADEISAFGKSLGAKEVVDITPSDSTQGDRATDVAIENALREKLPKLKPNDVVFLYLRGYCTVRNDTPFLVVANFSPADSIQNKENSGLVDLRKLVSELESLAASKVVVMLDHADLDVSNVYQLQEPFESYALVKRLLDNDSPKSSQSKTKSKADVVIVSAKDDFQPSHIRYQDGGKPATTLFFFAIQRAINELQKEHTNPKVGFVFSAFVEQINRYVALGSGSLQSPVVLVQGQRLDPLNDNSSLIFEFGKPTAKPAADAQTPAASPSTSEPPENPVSGGDKNALWASLENHWKQTDALFLPTNPIWPTDFAPLSWQKELNNFRKTEFSWLTSNDSPVFPDVTKWLNKENGPSSDAPSGFNNAWNKFASHTYSRAWLYDAPTLPESFPKYPYVPAANLSFDRTKLLARELARDGNSLGDWLRLANSYPNADASEASEFIESVRKHIVVLMEADETWKQLSLNPAAVSLENKNRTLQNLEQSRKRLFQSSDRSTLLDREIERLKSNAELTVWQLHHRCNLLLRFAQLSAIQRLELLRLCQAPNSRVLQPTNVIAPTQSIRDDIEKSAKLVSTFLEAKEGLLRPSIENDVHCVVRPSLDQQLEFVFTTASTSQLINPATLTMLRTITPQSFSLQIQRKDGSAPPTEITLTFSGLNGDIMRIQQAGKPLTWDKSQTVRVLNGTISFEASAQKQDDPSLPENMIVKLVDTSNGAATSSELERKLGIAWPLQNEFELVATRVGTSQKFRLNNGEPLLGAALVDEEGNPVQLSYELSLYNRSRVSRKARVQFYRVDDPKQGIVVPGTARNAESRPLWEKEDLLSKASSWRKLLPQSIVISTAADETISVSSLIANALKPAPTEGAAAPVAGSPTSNETTEIDAPYGLVCELKELDENDQVKGPADTTYIWIPLDTYDPFTFNQSLRCLTQVPPFSIDDNGKLNLVLESTDTLRGLSATPKVPIQIEFQARNNNTLENRQSFPFELTQKVERELPITNFKDDLFIAHISFGTFPKQASFVFQNGQDPQPIRKPEVFAQLESIEVQSSKPPQGTAPPESPTARPLLVKLPNNPSNPESEWALVNSENELQKAKLVAKINAILPAQQAFVGWRIYDVTRDQPQPLAHFYEQVKRIFKIRFGSDGTLQLKHTIEPLNIEYDVASIFEQQGVYKLQLFAKEWGQSDFVTGRELENTKPNQSEVIIVDRTPPDPSTINLKGDGGKSIQFNAKLTRNETYQVGLSLPSPEPGNVPIKEIKFGIDRNDDQKFQDEEEIKDSKSNILKDVQLAVIEYKVPMERINPMRFVARTIDYAGNVQDENYSQQFTVDTTSGTPGPANTAKTKNYTLTVVVKNTSGSTPSNDVDLKMDGRSYSAKEGKNVFIFKNIPGGSYQVTATSSAGTTQYEVSEKVDVSGDNTKITREIKLKTKEKPPAKQP